MKKSAFETILLGTIAELEAHVRIPSNRSTGRWGVRKSEAAALQEKMQWQKSGAHPNAPKFWGFPVDITPNGTPGNGTARIGDDEANRYFSKNNGFLMLKLAVENIAGNLALFMSYKKDSADGILWYPDPDENPREDGRTGYSAPIHNLVPSHEQQGKKFHFLFALVIEGDQENAHVRLYKINVTRGREHFNISATMEFTSFLPVHKIVSKIQVEKEDYQRLPIQAAVDQYLDRFSS